MTGYYAQDNGAKLSSLVLPVTPDTTYLAHFSSGLTAIDKVSPDGTPPVLADVAAVADLMAALEPIRNGRTLQHPGERQPAQPSGVEVADEGRRNRRSRITCTF